MKIAYKITKNIMRDYKTLLENNTQSVIEKDGLFKINHNYTHVAVLPYIIDDSGLLHKIGIVEYTNYYDNTSHSTLMGGYRLDKEASCTITANRLLFEHTKINITEAENWMFLGDLYSINSGTPIKLYCVNISENIEGLDDNFNIKFVDINAAITSDDTLLLTSYLRLFNLYYKQNISNT